jgi:hypothetical protein
MIELQGTLQSNFYRWKIANERLSRFARHFLKIKDDSKEATTILQRCDKDYYLGTKRGFERINLWPFDEDALIFGSYSPMKMRAEYRPTIFSVVTENEIEYNNKEMRDILFPYLIYLGDEMKNFLKRSHPYSYCYFRLKKDLSLLVEAEINSPEEQYDHLYETCFRCRENDKEECFPDMGFCLSCLNRNPFSSAKERNRFKRDLKGIMDLARGKREYPMPNRLRLNVEDSFLTTMITFSRTKVIGPMPC